MKEGVNPSGVG